MQTSKKRKTAEASVSRKKRTSVEGSASIVEQNSGEELIGRATRQSLEAMKNARSEVERLVKVRADHKLSISRANSVAKELKELIKVLSLYNY